MNFLTIFNNQIQEQKENVEREHHKYHRISHISFFSEKELSEYKESLSTILNNKHNNNLFHYIENTFLFKNQVYDKSFFISLKDQFIDNIIDNKEAVLSLYHSKPIELILVSYFHYIQQNINQDELFNLIKVIIENNNPVEFLTKFAFVSDYEMHYFVISFIELKNQEMTLHKNTPTNFFKNIYIHFLNFNKNTISNSLFTDLFYVYLNNKMYKSTQLFADKFSQHFTHIRIKDSLDLITKDNINNDYYERFIQLSFFDFNYSYSNHLDFISEHLTEDFFNSKKKNNSFLFFRQKDKKFIFQFSKNIQLKNNLYTIYKNIILKKMNSNKTLNSQEIKLLMQIYCISNNLFSDEEQLFILNYLNNCSSFQDIIKQENNLNIVLLFFSFYNNCNYFEYILENNYEIIKEIINVNYELLNQQVYNILSKYLDLKSFTLIFKMILQDLISSNYFINPYNEDSTRELMINSIFEENAQKIIDIDTDLFESLIDEKNKIIFEEVYIKKTIANF